MFLFMLMLMLIVNKQVNVPDSSKSKIKDFAKRFL